MLPYTPEKVLYTLTLDCLDEPAGFALQEVLNDCADDLRVRLDAMGQTGEIILSSSDGIFEYH